MNIYTQKAELMIKRFGSPMIPDGMVSIYDTQRTSKKVVQSFIANNITKPFNGRLYPFRYKHVGAGVYEFWFGPQEESVQGKTRDQYEWET